MAVFRYCAKDIYSKHHFGKVEVDNYEEAEKIVYNRVNVTCKNILDNTAVFKKDEKGTNGFKNFLKSLSIIEII